MFDCGKAKGSLDIIKQTKANQTDNVDTQAALCQIVKQKIYEVQQVFLFIFPVPMTYNGQDAGITIFTVID